MVRAGPIVLGILVALFGIFLSPIADATNSQTLHNWTSTQWAGVQAAWVIIAIGIIIILIGLAAPGPYYYERPYPAGPSYGPGYRRERVVERVVERETPRERVVEGPRGERRVVREEPEREIVKE